MPSQTFMNLKSEKQKIILNAAIAEFSNNEYPNVSLNKIIKDANIPRGTFYLYFKDKEDLFRHLMKINNSKLNLLTIKIFKNNKGDLKNSFIQLYDEIIKITSKKEYKCILKNCIIFAHLHNKDINIICTDLYNNVKDLINTNNLIEDTEFIFSILGHSLFKAVVNTIKNSHEKDKIKDNYYRELNIIFHGIYKEDKNV